MKTFTLKQLRYFDALARHGHFGQAAAACASLKRSGQGCLVTR